MPQETWTLVDDKPKKETWTLVETPLPPPKPVPGTDKITMAPKKSFLEQLKDVNWSRGGKVLGPRPTDIDLKSMKDIGQAFGSAVTGLAAFPIATGISAALMTPGAGRPTLPPELAELAGQHVAGKITVKTTTPQAQKAAEALGTPFAPFGWAIEAMPDAQSRTLMSAALLIAPFAKGYVGRFLKSKIASKTPFTPKEIDAAIKQTPLPKDVSEKVSSTRLEFEVVAKKPKLAMKDRRNGAIYEGRPGETTHGDMVARLQAKGIPVDDMAPGWTTPGGRWTQNAAEATPRPKPNPPAPSSTRLEKPPAPTGNPVVDAAAQEKFILSQRSAEASRPPSAGIPKQEIPGVTPGEIPGVTPANIRPINQNPAQVLAAALKQAPKVIPMERASQRRQAGERLKKAEEVGGPMGGEEGFKAAYGQMKGPMKPVDFERPNIGEHRVPLFQMIWDDPYLTMGERFSVESGLRRLLDEGKFPAKHEVELMTRVYGSEVGDALIGKLSTKEQLMFWATNIANVPRTLMASFDLSAPLRQGIWFIGRPRQFGRSLGAMFESLKSTEGYNAVVRKMAQKPTFRLGRESGLALSEIGSALNKTEEVFIGSGVIERIGAAALKKWPDIRGKAINLIPSGVKASERAYIGFLNKIRADVFDSMVNDAKDLGLYDVHKTGTADIFGNPTLSEHIARYVNIGSGRGNVSGLAKEHAALVNAVFFSPRLMSARFALFDPRTYFDIARVPRKVFGGKKYPWTDLEIIGKESQPRVSKFVRQQAFADAARFMGFYTTAAALAKFVLNQDLGVESRSSDFTKIISGNTSVDLGGGIGQYFRLATTISQPLLKSLGLIDEAYLVSSASGKKTKMGGGFNEVSLGDSLVRFFSQKNNPVFSFFMNQAFQKDPMGNKPEIAKEITTRIVPMVAQDIVELYKDDPDGLRLAIIGTLVLFGAGAQTYPPKEEKSFVDQTRKTRQEKFSGKPSGDIVIDELKRLDVKAVLGTKKIGGQLVPEESVAQVLKEAGPEVRKRIEFYMKNSAYQKATDEQKKKWLQKAVNAGWGYYKNKLKMGVK